MNLWPTEPVAPKTPAVLVSIASVESRLESYCVTAVARGMSAQEGRSTTHRTSWSEKNRWLPVSPCCLLCKKSQRSPRPSHKYSIHSAKEGFDPCRVGLSPTARGSRGPALTTTAGATAHARHKCSHRHRAVLTKHTRDLAKGRPGTPLCTVYAHTLCHSVDKVHKSRCKCDLLCTLPQPHMQTAGNPMR